MEGFKYVINPTKIPHVCFGSGLERVTLPMSGPSLSSFMRRNAPEVREFPGPCDYAINKSCNKTFPSKLGFSQFASKVPRLLPTNVSPFPPIGVYDVEKWKPFKQLFKPFGLGAKRNEVVPFLTPGPPTYPYHLPRRPQKMCTAFGSKRITWPEVAIVCSPYNSAKCLMCGQTPQGDYWHSFKANHDICRPCLRKSVSSLKDCSTDVFHRMRKNRELENYSRMRYCSFFHNHNGTTAATMIMSKKSLRYKIKIENYLMLYDLM